MSQLSILIPSRNEMFLSRTVEDILANIEADTDIFVGLDGQWASPPLKDHPRVTIFYSPQSIGQRAMTNQLARMSNAKYLLKCDAHCAFDKGFDRKLIEGMQDNYTVVPTMRNLHVFNWVCPNGHSRYQGPSGPCAECGADTTRDIVWIPKQSPQSNSYCFDSEPHFQYFKQYNKRPEGQGKITETMSLQGSCFMLTREKYWGLKICDEQEFGSWGSQGIEVAVKTWLSGGKVMVNQNTWYAHMFRTQGGDFSFPYEQHQSKVVAAKKKARDLFFGNNWEGQIRPLSWLVERFWPVQGWSEEDLAKVKQAGEEFYAKKGISKGIIYYTDNKLNVKIAHAVQKQLKKMGIPIVSASLKPMDFGKNIHIKEKRGYLTMFKQILAALEASSADIIYFCEHDVLYHPSHFDFVPEKKDKFYYNQNFWKIRADGFAVHFDANQVSGLCGYRDYLIDFYKKRIAEIEEKGFNRSYEPGGRDASTYEVWNSDFPNIDIRHENNLTGNKWSPHDFMDKSTCKNWMEGRVKDIPGWSDLEKLFT